MTLSPLLQHELSFDPQARFVLFGGGRLLLEMARRASANGHAVVAVCGPVHAAESIAGVPLRDALAGLGVAVIETSSLAVETLTDLVESTTIGMSLSAPWIFRPNVIGLFGGRLLNVHGTDLPHNRGGGGFTWQILRGDRRGGLSLHVLTAEVDVGELVLQRTFTYPDACRTPADFLAHREEHEHAFLDTLLDAIARGEALSVVAQDESRAVYWPRINTAVNGFIDWSWTAEEIVRFCDAFGSPHAGAGTFLRDAEVRIARCDVGASDGEFHPFQAGLVFRAHDGAFHVAARGGSVIIRVVTDGDREDCAARVRCGSRFHTPPDVLDRARRARPVITADGTRVRE